MPSVRRLSIATVLLTWLLVVSGSAVRVTEAAGSCGGWPLCQGQVLSVGGGDATVASTHRLLTVVAGCAILLLAAWVWRRAGSSGTVRRAMAAAVTLLAVQIAVGALTARGSVSDATTALHFALSMALFACVLTAAVRVVVPTSPMHLAGRLPSEGFALLSVATSLAILGVMLTGAYVTGQGAGTACRDWPMCNGRSFLSGGDRFADINALHRLATAGAALLIVALVWQAVRLRRGSRLVTWCVLASAALFAIQVLVGAGQEWSGLSAGLRVAHISVAVLVWGGLFVTALVAFAAAHATDTADEEQTRTAPLSLRMTVLAYVNLMKPRIIELLLVTTVPAMVLAARGMPNIWLIAGTVLGGMLTAGGANAINCYIDRDIDQVMKRTRGRTLATHQVRPERALTFGIAIGVLGFLELAVLINVLSAALSVSAILFYVFIYTMWLKRSTDQNIVIGGAAGAIPPLVGWAAVTGRVDLPALVLFGIIFLWTPPHFWALALRYRDDYASANVPMLPVVRGEEATRRQIFLYSVILVASTILLYTTGGAGIVYLVIALLLGAVLLRMAFQLLRSRDAFPVMKLFTYSITYLSALFAAMIVDQIARSLA